MGLCLCDGHAPSFTSNHQVLGRPNREVHITASSSLTIDADPLDRQLYHSSSIACPHRPEAVAQGLFNRALWPPLAALLPTNPPRCPRRLPPRAARARTQTSPASLLRLGRDTEPLFLMRHSDQSRGLPSTQRRGASSRLSVSSPTGSDRARSAPPRDCVLRPPPETPLRFPSASNGPMEGSSPGGDVDLLGNIPSVLDSIVSILEQREADKSDPELHSTVVRSAITLFNVFLDSCWATVCSGPTEFDTSLPDYISHRAPPVPPPIEMDGDTARQFSVEPSAC